MDLRKCLATRLRIGVLYYVLLRPQQKASVSYTDNAQRSLHVDDTLSKGEDIRWLERSRSCTAVARHVYLLAWLQSTPANGAVWSSFGQPGRLNPSTIASGVADSLL